MSNMALQYSHNLQPRVSGHLRNRIFTVSKCRRVKQRKQDILDLRLSWPISNHIFMLQNVQQWLTWCQLPGVGDLTKRQESLFQVAKVKKVAQQKPCILKPRIWWPLKILICRPPKDRKEALWMLDTFRSGVTWHFSNRIYRFSLEAM